MTIREDYLPGCGLKIFQDTDEFTFTTDAVLLAKFSYLVTQARALELGSGTGAYRRSLSRWQFII